MPPSKEPAVVAGAWFKKDGFLFEPRLRARGLAHGFTTRRLGDMKDGGKRRAAAALLGLPEPILLKQVHGTVICRASRFAQGLEADGWTLGPGDGGLCVGVYVADCVPLYLWSDDAKFAGIFHVGWKGMAAGMPAKAVEALVSRGAEVSCLNAAFGPHIGVGAYRVGPETLSRLPASSFSRRADGLHLDLYADTRRQLTAAGLRAVALGPAAPCTASHAEDFFSFRRDKVDARMLALLSLDLWPS